MTKESLLKARKLIVEAIDNNTEIDIVDRVELMSNLWLYLNPQQYDKTNKILQKDINNRRR